MSFQPENLLLARQRRGMKKGKLAAAIGVTPQMITAYESGVSEPSDERVVDLARVLKMPLDYFADPEMASPIAPEGASFRALSRMTAAQRDAAVASGAFCIRLNSWIDDRFEIAEPDVPNLQPGIIDPEGAAAYVRSVWSLGDQPIRNLLHTVEAHGVRVYALASDCREVDAFSFWHEGTPFVCLGTHKTPERSVFDLAHELGHLILHRGLQTPRGRDEEREADRFASTFLMPESDVRSHAPRFPTLEQLIEAKTRWRVSVAALNYRMHHLGLISDWHYRELCIRIAQAGRDNEPNSLRRDQSHVLTTVLTTMRQENITRADIARELNFTAADLDELLNGLVVTAIEGGRTTTNSPRPSLTLVPPK